MHICVYNYIYIYIYTCMYLLLWCTQSCIGGAHSQTRAVLVRGLRYPRSYSAQITKNRGRESGHVPMAV